MTTFALVLVVVVVVAFFLWRALNRHLELNEQYGEVLPPAPPLLGEEVRKSIRRRQRISDRKSVV